MLGKKFLRIIGVLVLSFFMLLIFLSIYISSNARIVSESVDVGNSHSRTYKYLLLDSSNEISRGFTTLSRSLRNEEFLSYSDNGDRILISSIGQQEFKCSGKCHCEISDEENNRRSSQVLSRGIFVLVASISSVFAYHTAKEHFQNDCIEYFKEDCHVSNIHSKIDVCQAIEEEEEIAKEVIEKEDEDEHSVLFVCWGNICRSPLCEHVFRQMKKEKNWYIDSCGTGGHFRGNPPDQRTQTVLKRHFGKDYKVTGSSRQITFDDFLNFEYILCMDNKNYEDCLTMREHYGITEKDSGKIKMITDFSKNNEYSEVGDPFYGNSLCDGFEKTFEICTQCCKNFLNEVER